MQLLILANKKFVIVADSDNASNVKKKEFEKNYKEYSKSWLDYADIVKGISTMEDFMTSEYITKCLKNEFPEFEYDNKKNAIQNIENVTNNKQEIKNKLVEKLNKNSIKDDYSKFISKLKETIDNL